MYGLTKEKHMKGASVWFHRFLSLSRYHGLQIERNEEEIHNRTNITHKELKSKAVQLNIVDDFVQ